MTPEEIKKEIKHLRNMQICEPSCRTEWHDQQIKKLEAQL